MICDNLFSSLLSPYTKKKHSVQFNHRLQVEWFRSFGILGKDGLANSQKWPPTTHKPLLSHSLNETNLNVSMQQPNPPGQF